MKHHYPYKPFFLPRLPVGLVSFTTHVQDLEALIDSCSSTNVLPRRIGDTLGFEWRESDAIELTKVRKVRAISERVGVVFQHFGILELSFAWIQDDSIPLLFGQLDFFEHFRVCFDAAEHSFTLERTYSSP
ncbi:MAG: hypothetical protein GY794_25440 [bacterium]|nr:hypothetical protein [bacterium]